MKIIWAAVLFVGLAAATSATDFAGTWKLKSTWPQGPALKTVGEIILDLKVDGHIVTGMAHIGSWPGEAPVAEGRMDGARITFDATGHLRSSNGIPTCHFEGTLMGDEMLLTMTMAPPWPVPSKDYKFTGKKQ